MRVVITGTQGPLFCVEESEAVVSLLSTRYPQFAKRGFGWKLSVEELQLLSTCPDPQAEAGAGVAAAAAAAVASNAALQVHFASEDAQKQFQEIRQTHTRECLVYKELTANHGFKLRHASQFGANYIGYRDVSTHGECLFYFAPLAELEQVRARRIARSVGKRAIMVNVEDHSEGHGSCLALSELLTESDSDILPSRKVLRRE